MKKIAEKKTVLSLFLYALGSSTLIILVFIHWINFSISMSFSSWMRSPKMHTILQIQTPKYQLEENNNFSYPICYSLANTTQ